MERKQDDSFNKKPRWKKIFIRLLIVLGILLTICTIYVAVKTLPFLPLIISYSVDQEWMPQEGVWYCEELQLQITFVKELVEENECFVVIDGEKIQCQTENDRGSKVFSVATFSWDFDDIIPIGTVVFEGECVELTEDEFVVLDRETGKEVIFKRVK